MPNVASVRATKNTIPIQLLMDASKILYDSQNAESLVRRNFVLHRLKKELNDELQTTKINKFLFSQELADKLRAAKAINKSEQAEGDSEDEGACSQTSPRELLEAIVAVSADTRPPSLLDPVKLLSHFSKQWSLLTQDKTLFSWIDGYQITFSRSVTQPTPPTPRPYSNSERVQFERSIHELLLMGAISECHKCKGQFVSSIFLVPKPNGKTRFILNLKALNKFIDTKHFKLEDLLVLP